MDKRNFDKKINKLENNSLLFRKLFWYMVATNIGLLLILACNINKERIIIVPQVAPEYKLWVSQKTISDEYLTTLSRNCLDLILNISPNNVKAQHQELLKLVSSRFHKSIQQKLNVIEEQILSNNLSQTFFIESIKVINNKNIVYIYGRVNEYLHKTLMNTNYQIYKLTFSVNNYRVQLDDIELLNDNKQLQELEQNAH